MGLKIMLGPTNSPWSSSGYGSACHTLARMFRDMGHEVGIMAYYGLEGAIMEWDGFQVYPRAHDMFGNDITEAHCAKMGADLVISLTNVHVLDRFGQRSVPWIPITPIEEDPLTDGNRHALQGAMLITVISKYGKRILNDAGIEAQYIPLPVDTSLFHPVEKSAARRMMGWKDEDYVIGHVGMNRGPRKGHDTLLQAFRLFLVEVPNAHLYIHTDIHQPDGIHLDKIAQELGIENRFSYPSRYEGFIGKKPKWMVGMYNSFDLYVQPSTNEGQAMPVWEASCVALPIVATDATALSEIMEEVEGIAISENQKFWQYNDSWSYVISPQKLTEGMLEAYDRYGHGYVSMQSRQAACENVSVPVVRAQWEKVLNEAEKMIRYQPYIIPWKEKPTVALVSSTAENCGISDYTKYLADGLSDFADITIYEIQGLLDGDMLPPNISLAHVHYEPSLIKDNGQFERFLKKLGMLGTKRLVTYHVVEPFMIQSHLDKKLIDKALIHWPTPDMQVNNGQRVKILGGMGVPVYRVPQGEESRSGMRYKYGFGEDDIFISTFGFASPYRSQADICAALSPIIKTNPRLRLQLIIPPNFLDPKGAQKVYSEINSVVRTYGLARQITLIQEKVPELEAIERLWISNIGFLFMPQHTRSSSSAIRFFTAARLPTVVTESTHFADVHHGVKRVGFSVNEMVQAMMQLLNDRFSLQQLRAETEMAYKLLQWPVFVDKHISLYKEALAE